MQIKRGNKSMSDPLQRIESQIAHQSNKMEALTDSISQLAQTLARKEERDHHIDEAMKEVKSDVTKLKDKVSGLEKISAGDDAMRQIFWRVMYVAIAVICGAVLYTVVIK